MFDHVGIRVSDRGASERFYTTVLEPLGLSPERDDAYTEWGDLALGDDGPPTTGLHLAFFAAAHDLVEAFWKAGVAAGYRSDGEPGPRPQYGDDYYGGFLLDPDGNSIEAVNMDRDRKTGQIDHLWIRVAELDASARFYETIAPHSGFARGQGMPGTAHFRGPGATFSLVEDERPPTRNLHLAFPGERAAVDAFHATATESGHRDNGAPGERVAYHPGYYAAFVLDPDGTNVEVVDHGE